MVLIGHKMKHMELRQLTGSQAKAIIKVLYYAKFTLTFSKNIMNLLSANKLIRNKKSPLFPPL